MWDLTKANCAPSSCSWSGPWGGCGKGHGYHLQWQEEHPSACLSPPRAQPVPGQGGAFSCQGAEVSGGKEKEKQDVRKSIQLHRQPPVSPQILTAATVLGETPALMQHSYKLGSLGRLSSGRKRGPCSDFSRLEKYKRHGHLIDWVHPMRDGHHYF